MTTEPSEQLRWFLRDHISSYEELEILLLLAREPDGSKSPAEVAALLGIPVDSAVVALETLLATDELLEREVLDGESRYEYAPRQDASRRLVSELESLYAQQRLAIIRIMSANAFERVRGAAARRLADAFRLERPKK